jgi:DNA-binding HxlR family transcriptional regulator
MNRTVKKWTASSPTIRHNLLAFLLQEDGRPKGFNEIRRYVSENKICSGITLSIYLKELEKCRIVKRVKVKVKVGKKLKESKHEKYVVRRALPRETKKAKRKAVLDLKLLRRETDRMIRETEKRTLPKEEACELIEYELVSFERLDFQIFDMFLKGGIPVDEFLSSKMWHIFVTTVFDLEIQLISAFHKKYPEQTLKVLEKLRNEPRDKE